MGTKSTHVRKRNDSGDQESSKADLARLIDVRRVRDVVRGVPKAAGLESRGRPRE
jgi:hypothetical protein